MSNLPLMLAVFRGDQPIYLHRLHETYSDIVRTAPKSLSFSGPGSAKEIYAERTGAHELRKDPNIYPVSPNGAYAILNQPSHANHQRQRRILNPGFSERAIKEQESVVSHYVDLLMQRFRENSSGGAQDMVAWFNWTTFDIIGDHTFNQPFGCLQESVYHPWISETFKSIKNIVIISGLGQYHLLKRLILNLFRSKINAARQRSNDFTKKMIAYRTSSEVNRTDYLSHALNHRSDKDAMTSEEIEATSVILVLGGSETSATLLSGAIYYLLTHPPIMNKLVSEIRSAFRREKDIDIFAVSK